MAFRSTQRALSQALRRSARSPSTPTLTRLRPAPIVACSVVAFRKFSTPTIRSNPEEGGAQTESPTPTTPKSKVHPSQRVYINNLPLFANQQLFLETLNRFSGIQDIHWLDSGVGKGQPPQCQVDFLTAKQAKTFVKRVKSQRTKYGDHVLVAILPTDKVYFRNLSGEDDEIHQFLGEHKLNVKSIVKFPGTNAGFIRFSTVAIASKVIDELNGRCGPDGQDVYLVFASSRPLPSKKGDQRDFKKNLEKSLKKSLKKNSKKGGSKVVNSAPVTL
ncbi:hypothetical protein FA15DRAFT_666544 [Coprinopsis marcescibilis]|uniref:RRM domain-containing protein n=1 Tax=Coprinopsis marcescibilis TaxID=230819 RepID=A0A5C3LFH3_COPMA|nr:hypothetical protein FA15DRAFT_666544 [Coprinopsis marcescibilis]